MRVKIGPYKTWIGVYQVTDKIPFVSEDTRDKIGDWLADTWIDDIFKWFGERERQIDVRIDPYDTWSMDHTLSLIILPMLKQLRETKHGAPWVDDEDVPDFIKSTTAPPKEQDWDTDDYHFIRWDWVLNEMIFTFENIVSDDWHEKMQLDKDEFTYYNNRIDNGLRLFGKYYRALWD